MNSDYRELFKNLVTAFYDDNFEQRVSELLSNPNIDKEKLSKVISLLCGISIKYDDNYMRNLKNAISAYKYNPKVVEKINDCSMSCVPVGGKTICQKSCPFDAILIDKEKHTTFIDDVNCMNCGLCVEACKEGNIIDKPEFIPLANLLKQNVPVIAVVAPSISGQYGDGAGINQLRSAFKKMGFKDMFEVAFFADMLTLKEVAEFDEHVKAVNDFMITSCCCPIWVGMIKKVYNDLITHVSPSISPMIAAGRVLKKLNPECKVVFISPCIAKKGEVKERDLIGDVDFVLTFEELKTIFEALNINPSEMQEDTSIEYASKGGRFYGFTGGVSTAVEEAIYEIYPAKYKLFKAVQVHGIKSCKEMLEKAHKGEVNANFIEGMGCIGGCVGGPKALIPKEEGKEKLKEFGEASNIKTAVDSTCMLEILKRLGINSVEDFKNKEIVSIFERDF